MRTIGQVLAEARSAKGTTLAEAERATKIRSEILQAIEADDLAHLPSPIYVKGFIKSYAEYLGIDPGNALAVFRRQFDDRSLPQENFIPDLSPKGSPKLIMTPGRALGVGISVLVLGFVGYLLAQYQSFAAAPLIEVSSPVNNTHVNNGTIEVSGRTDRDAALRINGQQVPLTESGAFSVSVSLPDGATELTLSSTNKLGRITTLKRTVIVDASVVSEPIGPTILTGSVASPQPAVAAATTTANQGVEITVKIGPNPSWVEVTLDSQPVSLSRIFLPGTNQVFKAQTSIKVRAGNAGSTEVTFNGVSQKLGAESEVVTKTFTR